MTYSYRLNTKELDRLASSLDKNRADVLKAVGFEVEAKAKVKAPYRTGALSNSIATEMQGDEAVRIGPGVEYGAFVELGTSRMAARPYLFPSVDEVVNAINSGEFWERLFKR